MNLALVVLVPLAAYEAVQVLPAAVIVLARVRESAARVVEVIDAPDLTPDPDPAAPLPEPVPPAALRVWDFVAGWAPEQWVAQPVSFDVAAGSSLAVVAPSGAGKSTVALGLARMVPTAGESAYGSVDLAAVTGDDARRVVELVQQDAHLFDTTIVENIRLARRSASDEEITAVLTDLGLGDWIADCRRGSRPGGTVRPRRVRRATATDRDRPGAGRPGAGDDRGRADRTPGCRQRRGRDGRATSPLPRAGPGADHPQRRPGRPVRPGGAAPPA